MSEPRATPGKRKVWDTFTREDGSIWRVSRKGVWKQVRKPTPPKADR